jgi:hypothetical protein
MELWIHGRSCVLTTAIMKNTVFWHMTSCSLFKVYRRFGSTYCLHHQGHGVNSTSKQWKWRRQVPPKRWYVCTKPYGIACQRTVIHRRENLKSEMFSRNIMEFCLCVEESLDHSAAFQFRLRLKREIRCGLEVHIRHCVTKYCVGFCEQSLLDPFLETE